MVEVVSDAAAQSSSTGPERPSTVTWAVMILVGFNLASWGLVLLLGRNSIPAGTVALGLTTGAQVVLLSWGLWFLQRWAALIVSAVAGPNLLVFLAGVLSRPNRWSVGLFVVAVPMTLLPILLIWHPASRRAYR